MNIVILQTLHEPFDKRVFHKVAKSLVADGHAVLSIAPSPVPVPDTDGIRFKTIPPSKGLPARFFSVFKLATEGIHAQPDAVLAVEPESWVAALLVKLVTRARVVFDVHEPIPPEFAKFFPRPFRPFIQWATVRAMRLFARFTDHIILTRATLDAEFKGLSVPCTVVINTNHLQPPCSHIPDALRERYASRPTILHQGLFGDTRGAYQLLEAMRILIRDIPDIKCILLGEYVYGDENAFRLAINEAGLAEAIDMLPPVPFAEVPAYIAVSRLGLILFQPGVSAHVYAMPHKMFDYMREGVPFIAPYFAIEVRHITQETQSGLLVDVADPNAIAQALLKLLRDPEQTSQLGKNGRAAVETKYNWQHEEALLQAAFNNLQKPNSTGSTPHVH